MARWIAVVVAALALAAERLAFGVRLRWRDCADHAAAGRAARSRRACAAHAPAADRHRRRPDRAVPAAPAASKGPENVISPAIPPVVSAASQAAEPSPAPLAGAEQPISRTRGEHVAQGAPAGRDSCTRGARSRPVRHPIRRRRGPWLLIPVVILPEIIRAGITPDAPNTGSVTPPDVWIWNWSWNCDPELGSGGSRSTCRSDDLDLELAVGLPRGRSRARRRRAVGLRPVQRRGLDPDRQPGERRRRDPVEPRSNERSLERGLERLGCQRRCGVAARRAAGAAAPAGASFGAGRSCRRCRSSRCRRSRRRRPSTCSGMLAGVVPPSREWCQRPRPLRARSTTAPRRRSGRRRPGRLRGSHRSCAGTGSCEPDARPAGVARPSRGSSSPTRAGRRSQPAQGPAPDAPDALELAAAAERPARRRSCRRAPRQPGRSARPHTAAARRR